MNHIGHRLSKLLLTLCTLALIGLGAELHGQVLYPDANIPDIFLEGNFAHDPTSGIDAFSFGTLICNSGNINLQWDPQTKSHPVIIQNAYRLQDGQFRHIGMSWARHMFLAVPTNFCGNCTGAGNIQLGAGCSNESSPSINASQAVMGARSEVNGASGEQVFPRVLGAGASSWSSIERRLQIPLSELGHPTARYFVESQIQAEDDVAAGKQGNNNSWRECHFVANGAGFDIGFAAPVTRPYEPAIFAWKEAHPEVVLKAIDIPGDGRVWVGLRIAELGPNRFRWDYAIQNLNSDRSISSLALKLPAGAIVSNTDFSAPRYHSGEVYSAAAWQVTQKPGVLEFKTDSYSTDPLANAIRWGSVYSFSYETDRAGPASQELRLGLFKPGARGSIKTKLPPVYVMEKVGGDQQATFVQGSFQQDLSVKIRDHANNPVSGKLVTFSTTQGVAILGKSTALTDNAGVAKISVMAASVSGALKIVASCQDAPTQEFDLFVRRFSLTPISQAGLIIYDLQTEQAFLPLLLAIDAPQTPIPSPYGTICTSITNPKPTLLVYAADPTYGAHIPSLITDAAGFWYRIESGLGFLFGSGTTLSFQLYSSNQLPDGSVVFHASNCVTLTF